MENNPELKINPSIDAPATMDSWEMLMDFIEKQCQDKLTDPKKIYGMRLAGEEILSNIVKETGSASGNDKDVHVWITSRCFDQAGKSWFEVLIEDNGSPFDPNLGEERNIHINTPINERPLGGLGLFLVQNYCDEATYEWTNTRNCYHLKMELIKL